MGFVVGFLGAQRGDCGVHFGRFGGFFCQGFGVGVGLGGEGGDGEEAGAVGFFLGGMVLVSLLFLLLLVGVFSLSFLVWRVCRLTFEFGDVHAKGVALFEDALAAALDEVVEALGELGHALSQVVEAKVHGG